MQSQRLVTVFVCLLAATPSMAQERQQQEPLTLADATARALEKNHAIQIEREAVVAAGARALSAHGDYDPQLRLDVSGGYRRMPTTSLFSGAPAGDLAPSRNGFESTFSISQLFKSGAVASFSSSQTQMQASQVTMFFVLPFVFLSGYIFPIEGMPTFFRFVSRLGPANYIMQIIRGIVLRGASVADLREPIAWLALYTSVILGLAVLRFKKTAA